MKPLAIDLYSGLHGWAEAFVEEGYDCVCFDIEDMCAKFDHPRREGIRLVLKDVLTLNGAELVREYGIPTVIVGSSPCQEFSYRAMPWKRAKALGPPHLGMELFNAQFRIQREASEAAGRYIPLVVENVRGAQKWVGPAKANFGSYYLWGDVGMVGRRVVAGVPRFGVSVAPVKAHKVPGIDFNAPKAVGFNVTAAQRYREGVKQAGIGGVRTNGKGDGWFEKGAAQHGSRSNSRKAASAQIAKIPYPLAQYIARAFQSGGELR